MTALNDSADDLKSLKDALISALAQANRIIAEKDAEIEILKNLLRVDPMTGVYNRAGLIEQLRHTFSSQLRSGGSTFIVFVDVDDFKTINTNYGHDGGDFALITLATRMKSVMRDHDIVSRWAGDEFVIAFHLDKKDIQNQIHKTVIDRILEFCRMPIVTPNGQIMNVTCSLGVTRCDTPVENIEYLITASNKAMFKVKESGKNSAAIVDFSQLDINSIKF